MLTLNNQDLPARPPGHPSVKLVIVDDHQLVRDGLRALLASVPSAVQIVGEAGTARDGHTRIQELQPDLVVLDLNLPDQNGVQLAAEIRSRWPAIKILVLTGSGQPAAADVAQAGVDGFVRKEDCANEFLRAIPVVMAGKPYFSPVAADAIAQALWKHPKGLPTGPALAEREQEVGVWPTASVIRRLLPNFKSAFAPPRPIGRVWFGSSAAQLGLSWCGTPFATGWSRLSRRPGAERVRP